MVLGSMGAFTDELVRIKLARRSWSCSLCGKRMNDARSEPPICVDCALSKSAGSSVAPSRRRQSLVAMYRDHQREFSAAEMERLKGVPLHVLELITPTYDFFGRPGSDGAPSMASIRHGYIVRSGGSVKFFRELRQAVAAARAITTPKSAKFRGTIKDQRRLRVSLTPDEHRKVLEAGAVWHHGPKNDPTPAVWKVRSSTGEVRYITDTHRAARSSPTLEGAIRAFRFIKTTA